MRLTRLRLKGITRFSQPIDLDFSQIPPGLVAIVGGNGEGKTTLLDAGPGAYYRRLPSRGPVIDAATDRDSYIDLEARFDAGLYRARLNVDGVAKTSDAVLERDGIRLNDGKVTTFDEVITRELPAYSVLLASAFAAQNKRGSFSTLDRKARKDLFTALLGLEELDRFATTSRAAALAIEKRVIELRTLISRLLVDTDETTRESLRLAAERLQAQVGAAELRDRETAADVDEAEAALRNAQSRASLLVALAEELRVERMRLVSRESDCLTLLREADRRTEDQTREEQAITARVERALKDSAHAIGALPTAVALERTCYAAIVAIDTRTAKLVADKRTLITNNEHLVELGDAVMEAEITLNGLEAQLRVEQDGISLAEDALATRDKDLARAQQRVRDLAHWPGQSDRAVEAAKLLGDVPFGERCAEAGCQFVKAAVDARDSLAACEVGVSEHAAAQLREQDAAAAQQAAWQKLKDLRQAAKDIQITIGRDHAHTRSRAAALRVSAGRIAELEADITQIEADAEREREEARARHALATTDVANSRTRHAHAASDAQVAADREREALATRLEAERRSWAERADAAKAARDETAQQVLALEQRVAAAQPAQDELTQAERQLSDARVAQRQAAVDVTRLEGEAAQLQRDRDRVAAQLAERQRLEAATSTLETELVEWQALARVFGRDGLPVHEIDAAGPIVSALANDLLQACFGARFALELVTQEAKAGGKGLKETFEIKVYDSERGGEPRDLADLSGGEQVIVDEALKSAIALFVNSRNVLPVRTAWRDETTGALDPENALRYVAMLRRVRERGGFHHILFVSHNADAAALADVQIYVHGGEAEFRFPPFTVTEAA